jgi:endonuclease G
MHLLPFRRLAATVALLAASLGVPAIAPAGPRIPAAPTVRAPEVKVAAAAARPPPGTIAVLVNKEIVHVPAPTPRARVAPELKPIESSPHVALGIPAAKESSDVLIDKGHYVISYSPTKNEPSWVSWHLTKATLSAGRDRANDFRGDKELPKDLYHTIPKDYLHSGYDMGHLLPSADRSRTPSQNESTFLMTNMTPQRPELNRGPWKYLEDYQRELVATKDKELFVIAGGIMPNRPKEIGNGVEVPHSFFKVAVVLDKGQGIESVTKDTQVISVIMPNNASVEGKKWTSFLVTPHEIEEATGYTLFTKVPPHVRDALLAKKSDIEIKTVDERPK